MPYQTAKDLDHPKKIHQKFNFANILKIQGKVARRQLILMPYQTAKDLDHPKLNGAVF